MTTDDDRCPLTFDEALALLPDADRIHTFRSAGLSMIGADWPLEILIATIRQYGAELAGPSATRMGHGIAIIDNRGPLFVETRGTP